MENRGAFFVLHKALKILGLHGSILTFYKMVRIAGGKDRQKVERDCSNDCSGSCFGTSLECPCPTCAVEFGVGVIANAV